MYPASSNFWSASDRYFGRVASATAGKPAEVFQRWIAGSEIPNKGKRQRPLGPWASMGQPSKAATFRQMPSTRYSDAMGNPAGAVAIRTDPNFRQNVLNAIALTSPKMVAVVDKYMGALALHAFKKWPIDSGFSKGMVFLEYTPMGPGKLKASVGNGAWYAFYIKPRKLGRKNAWQTLIVRPSKKALRDMADTLADELATPGRGLDVGNI